MFLGLYETWLLFGRQFQLELIENDAANHVVFHLEIELLLNPDRVVLVQLIVTIWERVILGVVHFFVQGGLAHVDAQLGDFDWVGHAREYLNSQLVELVDLDLVVFESSSRPDQRCALND